MLQGYLAHDKQRSLRTLQWEYASDPMAQAPPPGPLQGPRHMPTVGFQKVAVFHERGTHVAGIYTAAVKLIWHIRESHGQILALVLQETVLK